MMTWIDEDERERAELFERLQKQRLEREERGRREPWKPGRKDLRTWMAHDLQCMLVHGPASLNGYVSVPPEHPFFCIHYSECPRGCDETYCDHTPESLIDVHGGITFSNLGEDCWWFGFDTAHHGDFLVFAHGAFAGRIWEDDDVALETERMAKQLSEVWHD